VKALTVLIVLFCLAGVVLASLALGEHYNTEASPCKINEVWDCGVVNKSPYAVFHGVPVAIIGIVGYALLGALAGRMPRLTAALALIALGFALRLTWIEWKVLLVWCMYCVGSQITIAIVTVLALVQAGLSFRPPTHYASRF
jgi:vitamin-K-epoxide reductase (warfarin-sensitive)